MWSFFLQPVVGDDALHAADADGITSLPELLGDDLGGSLGIQKAVANDLADEFVRAAVIGNGATLFAFERGGAMGLKLVEELEIALLGIAVFTCGLRGAKALALAFNEHGELAGDLVVLRNGNGTNRADESGGGAGEFEHEGG